MIGVDSVAPRSVVSPSFENDCTIALHLHKKQDKPGLEGREGL